MNIGEIDSRNTAVFKALSEINRLGLSGLSPSFDSYQTVAGINADNNANPDDPFFSCGTNRCEFGLRTAGLPVGTVTVFIRMPDSRVFQAAVTLVP